MERIGLLKMRKWVVVIVFVALMLTVSSPALVKGDNPPAVPAQPTVDTVSHDSVSISWADPGDSSITGYQVLRRNVEIHGERVFEVIEDDTGTAATSYEDTTVAPETTYRYRVKARNAHGLSGWSKVARVATPAAPLPANEAPTGLPTVTGTVRVGETLTADTSGISDSNGLTNVSYAYQWIRDDGNSEAVIPGATGQTYTLTDDDLNQTVKVTVSFTDDDGYTETLTSAATGMVDPPANEAPTGLPTVTGTVRVGETLTADTSGISDSNGLTNVSYAYQWIRDDGNSEAVIPGATGETYTLTDDDLDKAIKVQVSFTDDDGYTEMLTSAATGTVGPPPNESPTGLPVITGTARVGETLTADTSGISDANGLNNVSYGYQWLRNDGNSDTTIPGATGQTYTLTGDDLGKSIKVQVSFTDDDGYSESLTSGATGAVATLVSPPTPGTVDLAVGSPVQILPGAIANYGIISYEVDVRNRGQDPSPATTLRHYRSLDDTISGADVSIDSREIEELGSGEEVSVGAFVRAPTSAGVYYYGACVDPVPGESALQNNCSESLKIDYFLDLAVVDPRVSDNDIGVNWPFDLTVKSSARETRAIGLHVRHCATTYPRTTTFPEEIRKSTRSSLSAWETRQLL